ncbi:endonuclease/exonuclease/phosphatase family protein [Rhodococcus sp. NPDC058505]|uniref:endonuclease/exonuclease/phosphatase family protein n=1 Tax=unclassified Rhodococcus (in: high G+C Gram-positive bacteria) TaxID=192944 RepID=UPI003668D9CE
MIRWGALVVGWAAVAAAAAGVLAHVVPVTSAPIVVAAAAAPYLVSGIVLAVLVFLAVRDRLGLAVATAVAAGAAWTQAPLYVHDAGSGANPERGLTVLQANIEFGKADPESVVAQVRSRGVDLMTVNELTVTAMDGLTASGLDELLPYRYVRPAASGADGTGIWSRYPLSEQVQHPGFAMAALSARATLPGGDSLTVLAAHPVPPWPRHQTPIWADELDRLHGILDGLRTDADTVVMAADFNATWDHAQFRALLGDGVRDAAEQAGSGVLRSYPADRWLPPLLSIDRILVAGARATDVGVVDLPGSDHRGVLARIMVPGHP